MNVIETTSQGLARELSITVDAAEIERVTEARLQAMSANVKIPGFRPGKVPMPVLKQRYSQQVMGEVLERTVDESTKKALADKNYQPAMRPNITIKQFGEGQPLEFTVTFDIMPTVPTVKIDDIALERDSFEVTEADIAEGLERLAKANKKIKPIESPRASKKGDVLRIDFEGSVDGVLFDGGKAENFSIEIGSGQLIPGFEDQLIGLKPNDESEVKVTFPTDYHAENLKGKAAVFKIKLREILEASAPEINDEFATNAGFKDLAELKDRVRGKIKKDVDGVVRMHLKKALFDALDGRVTFDLPQSMVEEEFKGIWQKLEQSRGVATDAKEAEEQKAEYRKVAERRVRLGLYLAEVAKQQAIRVSPQELQEAVMEHARMFPGQESKVVDFYRKNPAELTMLQGPIIEEKAVDYVLTQIKITDKPSTVTAIIESDSEEETPKAKSSEKKPSSKKAKSEDGGQGELL